MKLNINELIFSSGGIYGISLIGFLEELSSHYPLRKIKNLIGCSIGSLILFFFNIGYTVDEIKKVMFDMDFTSFHDLKIMNFIEKMGFDEGDKIKNVLRKYTNDKNISENITFQELYEKTGVILTITVSNLSKNIPEYHNVIHTPHLNILESLQMSMCIPFLFMPILSDNNYYCDGALTDPYPYYYFNEYNKNKKDSIGVWLLSKSEYDNLNNKSNNVQFQEPFEYIKNILFMMYNQFMKYKYRKINKNTIPIVFEKSSISVDITYNEKYEMYTMGIIACRKFINKKLRLIRKKRLYQKYFNLWKFYIFT